MLRAAATWIRKVLPYGTRRQLARMARFFAPPPHPQMLFSDTVFPSIEGTYLSLINRGFQPRFVIDVGAFQGDWAQQFHSYFPEAFVMMIEAQDSKRVILNQLKQNSKAWVDFRIALLGAESGTKVQFVEMSTGSSVFEEQSPYQRQVVEKELVTLDSLLDEEIRKVDLIKLDVQGYELEVLQGASKKLSEAHVVLMEVSFIPINRGAPLVAEVIQFMTERNFKLVDFCSQIRRKDGVLWQSDLLFIRTDSPYMPQPVLTTENWG